MLTNIEITNTIESAFRPLRCAAEIWDYEGKVRFKVFDAKNNVVLRMPQIVIGNIRDEHQLHIILSMVREKIIQKGFTLEPWL